MKIIVYFCPAIKLIKHIYMKAVVSIIMGSTSDLPVMEKTAQILNDFKIPFEINALSAHRTPEEVEKFTKDRKSVV